VARLLKSTNYGQICLGDVQMSTVVGDIVACVSDNMTGTIKIEEQFFIVRIDDDGVVKLLDEESDIRYTTLGDLLLNFDKIW